MIFGIQFCPGLSSAVVGVVYCDLSGMIEKVQDVAFTSLADCIFEPLRFCTLNPFEVISGGGQSAWQPTLTLTAGATHLA
jgi:hypothetical protein